MNYQEIQTNKLKPDPSQPRRNFDDEEMKSLAVSITNEGVINPIEVDGDFVIVTGERRWRAATMAGLKTVPVNILVNLGTKERFIRQVQENIHQNTMAPLDTANALDKIRGWLIAKPTAGFARDKFHQGEYHQVGVKELNELLGTPKETIRRYLELLGVSPELKKALQVPGFQMSKIGTITEAPEKYRQRLGHLVATQKDVSRDSIRHVATALRRADKYGEGAKASVLLRQNFEGLNTVETLNKINKIVPDEFSRIKGPADAVKVISEKAVELMEVLEDHPLDSLDPVHRALTIKDLNALGFYVSNYLQGKDLKNMKIPQTKLLSTKAK